jgi:hypothetical protein
MHFNFERFDFADIIEAFLGTATSNIQVRNKTSISKKHILFGGVNFRNFKTIIYKRKALADVKKVL